MNTSVHEGTALIADASSALGEAYADRLARRGYDLILVAPGALLELAIRITDQTHRSVETITADLADGHGLARVERLLRTDASITLLVNNPGPNPRRPVQPEMAGLDALIALGICRLVQLTAAMVPAFVARRRGTIINVAPATLSASVMLDSALAGSGAFVATFTQSLHQQLGGLGLRIQAVMPVASATGCANAAPLSRSPGVPTPGDTVDAALSGLDRGELVTIPGLSQRTGRERLEAQRLATGPGASHLPASPCKH